MATAIRELMTTDPIVLGSSTSVREAAQRMQTEDVGDVLVEEDGQVRGLLTDRDIVVRVVAEGSDPDGQTIGDICSSELYSVTPDQGLDDAVALMRQHAVRRLPVLEDGAAVGILSIGDLAVARDPDSALADISASPAND